MSEVHLRVDSFGSGTLQGQIDFHIPSSSSPLSFCIPTGCSVTQVTLDDRVLSRVSDRTYAQELVTRSDSVGAYYDSTLVSDSFSVLTKVLESRRDLISFSEALTLQTTDRQDSLTVYLGPKTQAVLKLTLFFTYESPLGLAGTSYYYFARFFPTLPNFNPITIRMTVNTSTSADSTNSGEYEIIKPENIREYSELGLFIGWKVFKHQTDTGFHLYTLETYKQELLDFVSNFPRLLTEIGQCIAGYTGDTVPTVKLVFVPDGVTGVHGDVVLLGTELLRSDALNMVVKTLEPLALGVAKSAVSQQLPRVKDVWLREGLERVLAGRVVEQRLGGNEWKVRFVRKRELFHKGVERGDDEIPLHGNSANFSDFFRLKAELVLDTLRQALLGNEEFRVVVRTLAERRERADHLRPVSTEDFFDLCEEIVDRESERALKLRSFRYDYIECVGCPIISLNLQFPEKKHLQVRAFQRPLQPSALRISSQRAQPGVCGCGEDPQCRTDAGFEGPAGAEEADWRPARRVWEGAMDVTVFRAPYVPLSLSLELQGVSYDGDERPVATAQLSASHLMARKHECVRTRTARNDELVHGYVVVEDERWLLCKLEVFQSQLMWTNQLQFSRDVAQEMQACEALGHIKGSTWVLEVLIDAVKNNYYSYTTKAAAARALCHMIAYNNDRDAFKMLWGGYLAVEAKDKQLLKPQDVYVFSETVLALSRACVRVNAQGQVQRVEETTAKDIVTACNELLKAAKLGVSSKRVDERVLHACTEALVYAGTMVFKDQPQVLNHPLSEALLCLKSDVYGVPLQSRNHEASVSVLGALAESDPPAVRRNLAELVFTLVDGRLTAQHCQMDVLEHLMDVIVVIITGEQPMTSPQSILYYLNLLAERVYSGTKPGGPVSLFTGLIEAPVTRRTLFCLLKSWEAVRRQVKRGRLDRKSFDSAAVCDLFWATLLTLARLEQPEILEVAKEVYHAAYGLKVPKCVQGVAEKPGEEAVKQYQQYVMKGRIYRPPKEQSVGSSRIVIGGVSRKIE